MITDVFAYCISLLVAVQQLHSQWRWRAGKADKPPQPTHQLLPALRMSNVEIPHVPALYCNYGTEDCSSSTKGWHHQMMTSRSQQEFVCVFVWGSHLSLSLYRWRACQLKTWKPSRGRWGTMSALVSKNDSGKLCPLIFLKKQRNNQF